MNRRNLSHFRAAIAYAAASVIIWGIPGQAAAQSLTVALSMSATSLDPLFYVGGANSALARSIFDPLVMQDQHQALKPDLAIAWRPISDTEWEFKLRPSVRFHDGSPFGAPDVVASIERVAVAAQGSPSSFRSFVKNIKLVRVVDDLTIRIVTDRPTPLLPANLSRISIMPRADAHLTTQQLNDGIGVIGTGPFKFAGWKRDDHVDLVRNPGYWAGQAPWDHVTLRFLSDDGARLAALLGGDVDMVESVPTPDVAHLRRSNHVTLSAITSNRVLYLDPDVARETSPYASGPDGKNPLRLLAVRRAMALAIDRQALIARIADGQGEIAAQLVPNGYFGASPSIKPLPYDPAKARALLQSVGLAHGFRLTFHATNDRYPNDAQIAQALGQMWSRIGIDVQIVTLPGSVYFPRATHREFSLIMGGAADETGEASGVLGPLLATYGPSQGQGNRGRYSSPAFDQALSTALATIDDQRRSTLLQQAMQIGMSELGVIPLYFVTNTWALRKGLHYAPRTDGYTLPYYVYAVRS
ncbi:ABC transporter substrate-binding protein [Paraburkholderia tropica]|uniref:ABC transporter substrate-binding protein n=1 Tax=Paraburkholderia tropica TaxID=92647 RepID=UPI002AB7401C|nr:ABC transporter substrate-binding protein [Paraburkholderia tropica]